MSGAKPKELFSNQTPIFDLPQQRREERRGREQRAMRRATADRSAPGAPPCVLLQF
jgi:hypothetical protein